MRNKLRPTVSKIRASAPTATVSRGRFSVKTCEINCGELVNQYVENHHGERPTLGAELAKKIKLPK